jgi:hypothetical protein
VPLPTSKSSYVIKGIVAQISERKLIFKKGRSKRLLLKDFLNGRGKQILSEKIVDVISPEKNSSELLKILSICSGYGSLLPGDQH